MRLPALGDAVESLPWLSPCAASLAALARTPTLATWLQVRSDPGAVLLILRQAGADLDTPGRSFFPLLLRDPAVAEGAAAYLENAPPCFVDWGRSPARPIHEAGIAFARLASRLAERTGQCDPDRAWVAGLLAPLGWLAVCALDPARVEACLADPALVRCGAETQRRHWGLDQAALGRRLVRRWRMPAWLAGVTGRLGLSADAALTLGADPGLFRILQLSVALVQRLDASGLVPLNVVPSELAAALGLPAEEAQVLEREAATRSEPNEPALAWESPAGLPLLTDLLRLAAENRRLRGSASPARLETELDELHQALEHQCAGEAERLQARKLAALAEFAAGAGHEINNPLAVISGQAQYLLGQLRVRSQGAGVRGPESGVDGRPEQTGLLTPDPCHQTPGWERALKAIVDQAQRIHGILRDLWQFARPPEPTRQAVDLAGLVQEVSASLSEYAAQRRVQLRFDRPVPGNGSCGRSHLLTVQGDPGQLRTALACLLRNAIEAAPTEGWASIRLELTAADRVDVLVEDSGTPPGLHQREHLFDPFYSGRPAGRGRGLGLPMAWRLARAHGGDVRFVGVADQPTRFVLTLPCDAGKNGATHPG